LFQVEAGPFEYDLALRYGGLREQEINNKTAVAAALGRLLRMGMLRHEIKD